MPLLMKMRSLLRNLVLSRRDEAELDKEVRVHLKMLTEQHIRSVWRRRMHDVRRESNWEESSK